MPNLVFSPFFSHCVDDVLLGRLVLIWKAIINFLGSDSSCINWKRQITVKCNILNNQ